MLFGAFLFFFFFLNDISFIGQLNSTQQKSKLLIWISVFFYFSDFKRFSEATQRKIEGMNLQFKACWNLSSLLWWSIDLVNGEAQGLGIPKKKTDCYKQWPSSWLWCIFQGPQWSLIAMLLKFHYFVVWSISTNVFDLLQLKRILPIKCQSYTSAMLTLNDSATGFLVCSNSFLRSLL